MLGNVFLFDDNSSSLFNYTLAPHCVKLGINIIPESRPVICTNFERCSMRISWLWIKKNFRILSRS